MGSVIGARSLDSHRKPDTPARLDAGADVFDPRAEDLVSVLSIARGAA
jgi:hypothetical protein